MSYVYIFSFVCRGHCYNNTLAEHDKHHNHWQHKFLFFFFPVQTYTIGIHCTWKSIIKSSFICVCSSYIYQTVEHLRVTFYSHNSLLLTEKCKRLCQRTVELKLNENDFLCGVGKASRCRFTIAILNAGLSGSSQLALMCMFVLTGWTLKRREGKRIKQSLCTILLVGLNVCWSFASSFRFVKVIFVHDGQASNHLLVVFFFVSPTLFLV